MEIREEIQLREEEGKAKIKAGKKRRQHLRNFRVRRKQKWQSVYQGAEEAVFVRLTLDTATGITVSLCIHVENYQTALRGEKVQLRKGIMIRRWRDVVTCMTH